MQVNEVMHKGAMSVPPDAPIRILAKEMRDADIGALPVKADGKIVGIVTDRDITCRTLGSGRNPEHLVAKDVMSDHVVSCTPDDDIETVVKTMESKRIRRMPVIDKRGSLVGMLSLGDISHKISKESSGEVLRALSAHHR